jgi:hypothetical protein
LGCDKKCAKVCKSAQKCARCANMCKRMPKCAKVCKCVQKYAKPSTLLLIQTVGIDQPPKMTSNKLSPQSESEIYSWKNKESLLQEKDIFSKPFWRFVNKTVLCFSKYFNLKKVRFSLIYQKMEVVFHFRKIMVIYIFSSVCLK